MPLANYQPHGSYIQPIAVPSNGPDGGTTLCLPPICQEWLPIIVGCLDQLRLPTTWGPISDAAMEQVQSWSEQLKLLVAQAGPCMELRWSDADCAIEQSFDGGVTWAKLPGWPVGPPACFVGAPGADGAPGAPGPAGPTVPTVPPNPQGVSLDQQACNIASYLTIEVIDVSITQALSAIAASTAIVDFFAGLLGVLGGLTLVLDVAAYALSALYTAIQAGTASHYTSALADAAFKSDVQCAIYNAIKADGYVTPGNFAALLANIAAISYTYPDVVTTVHDYVSALGVTGVQALQVEGSLYVGFCGSCGGGGWCYTFEFGTIDTPAWTVNAWTTSLLGTFSGGNWISALVGGSQQIQGVQNFTPTFITSIQVNAQATVAAGGGTRAIYTASGGVLGPVVPMSGASGPLVTTVAVNATVDTFGVVFDSTSYPGSHDHVGAVTVRGTGVCPFGLSNCS